MYRSFSFLLHEFYTETWNNPKLSPFKSSPIKHLRLCGSQRVYSLDYHRIGWAQSQARQYGIWSGQSGSGTDFSPNASVFPCQQHCRNIPYSFSHLSLALYGVIWRHDSVFKKLALKSYHSSPSHTSQRHERTDETAPVSNPKNHRNRQERLPQLRTVLLQELRVADAEVLRLLREHMCNLSPADCQWKVLQATWILLTRSHSIYLRSDVIFSHLLPDLPSGFFPLRFPSKTL
jgi:hypothetical protein